MVLLPKLEKAGGYSAGVYSSFSCAMHTQARQRGSHWLNQLRELRRVQRHAKILDGMLQSLGEHCTTHQAAQPTFHRHEHAEAITGLCNHVYHEHCLAPARGKKNKRTGSRGGAKTHAVLLAQQYTVGGLSLQVIDGSGGGTESDIGGTESDITRILQGAVAHRHGASRTASCSWWTGTARRSSATT